jgi:hypothetical protein
MTTAMETQEREFEALLEKNHLRAMQILQGAFSLGVAMFALVIGVFYLTAAAQMVRMDATIFPIFSGVHAFVALSCWVVGLSAPSLVARLAPSGLIRGVGTALEGSSAAERILAQIRTAFILRLALLQGPALFGLVICLLGSKDGTLREKPIFWLNGLSAALFLAYSLATFPTRDRAMEMFRDFAGRLEEASSL